jgi:hypothetical protein
MIQLTPGLIKAFAPNCRAPIAVAANLNVALVQYQIGIDIDHVPALLAPLLLVSP